MYWLNPVQHLFQAFNSLLRNFAGSSSLYFQARTALRLLMVLVFWTKLEPTVQVKSNLS